MSGPARDWPPARETRTAALAGCRVRHFGVEPYPGIWEQMKAFTARRTGQSEDELWLLQHSPVYTLGQAGKSEHILHSGDIPVLKIDRGGQVTYHGPGQLVVYLMIDLRRRRLGVRELVDLIEQGIIRMLAGYAISAATRAGAPGVYVGDEKIAALGLRIRNGCSYHGLSLNVDMDLQPFSWINPCGYQGLRTTQVKDHLQHAPAELFAEVREKLLGELLEGLL